MRFLHSYLNYFIDSYKYFDILDLNVIETNAKNSFITNTSIVHLAVMYFLSIKNIDKYVFF